MDQTKAAAFPYLFPHVEQKLHAQTDAQNGLFRRLTDQYPIQARSAQAFRRVGKRAHTRQNDGVGALQHSLIAGDAGIQAEVAHGVGNAFQVAHAVIHDSGIAHVCMPPSSR